jgi:hypothetical protein
VKGGSQDKERKEGEKGKKEGEREGREGGREGREGGREGRERGGRRKEERDGRRRERWKEKGRRGERRYTDHTPSPLCCFAGIRSHTPAPSEPPASPGAPAESAPLEDRPV